MIAKKHVQSASRILYQNNQNYLYDFPLYDYMGEIENRVNFGLENNIVSNYVKKQTIAAIKITSRLLYSFSQRKSNERAQTIASCDDSFNDNLVFIRYFLKIISNQAKPLSISTSTAPLRKLVRYPNIGDTAFNLLIAHFATQFRLDDPIRSVVSNEYRTCAN